MGIILGFLKALKLPVKLLKGLVKKRKRKDERERKLRKHVRNFAPRNISWQKSIGKDKKKKGKSSKKN